MTCEHDGENYRAMLEGMCPTCLLPLEVRDGAGWCSCCGAGWSGNKDRIDLHIEARVGPHVEGAFTFSGGPARMRFSRPL